MILGISCFYHDSAAALVDNDGHILAAAQEERFTREKHTSAFPQNAISSCLKTADCSLGDVDSVAYYEVPPVKFERILDTFSSRHGNAFADVMPTWIFGKAYQTRQIEQELRNMDRKAFPKLFCVPHHASHAASAFYPCPWDRALIITVDGVGEYATTSVSIGCGTQLQVLREIHFPDSLGLFYSAMTYFCGFKVNSGEYKLMGLAPYGMPRYSKSIQEKLLTLHTDGSFRVSSEYFGDFSDELMVTPALDDIFDGPPLALGQPPTQREADIAASVQQVLEESLLNLVGSQLRATGEDRLCLAGGVALNCVANARLLRELPIKDLWIQPAAGDAGGALGAALFLHHSTQGHPKRNQEGLDTMQGALLGPSFSNEDIRKELDALGAVYTAMDTDALIMKSADLLARGQTLAWFQGRMEYGPRALGSRSILADPRLPNIQRDLNLRIKKRESFRPFAPVVLDGYASDWFDMRGSSPYMLLTAPVKAAHRYATAQEEPSAGLPRIRGDHSDIPAVTHVDYSARVQTVSQKTHPMFHRLLDAFSAKTGCPILVNTSFNVRGEPIVCTPRDAFSCFMNAGIDYLAIGHFLLASHDQDQLVAMQCAKGFPAD